MIENKINRNIECYMAMILLMTFTKYVKHKPAMVEKKTRTLHSHFINFDWTGLRRNSDKN